MWLKGKKFQCLGSKVLDTQATTTTWVPNKKFENAITDHKKINKSESPNL